MNERQQVLPLTELTAISTPDGRYRHLTAELAPFVSEYNLIRTRLEIEAKYLVALSKVGLVRPLSSAEVKAITSFGPTLSLKGAEKVKEIEDKLQHDVKAMETAFRNEVKGTSLEDVTEMIHFGITSEDVNNLAYRLMLERATQAIMIPALDDVTDFLVDFAEQHKRLPMLGRTHGQPAVPTTVGKEFVNFAARLNEQTRQLHTRGLTGKLTGAVGNLNALNEVHPEVDWLTFSSHFVESLGFTPNLATTQINPYEDVIEYLQSYMRINGVVKDLDQDIWRYISDRWLIQQVVGEEVGSSTMPQKVNPIRFENSEGNEIIANGILGAMCEALGQSRLQRDLRDSTIIRNIGLVLGFCLISYKNTRQGLARIKPNPEQIMEDLNKDWAILAEPAQIMLREAGVSDAYGLVKSLSRGIRIGKEEWQEWVAGLPVANDVKTPLLSLTPEKYIGLAVKLTDQAIRKIKASRIK